MWHGLLFLFFALATTMTDDHNNIIVRSNGGGRILSGWRGVVRGRTAVTSPRSVAAATSRVFATRQRSGRGSPARRHRRHTVPGENAFLKNSIPIIPDIPIRTVETAARIHSHTHTLSRSHTHTRTHTLT